MIADRSRYRPRYRSRYGNQRCSRRCVAVLPPIVHGLHIRQRPRFQTHDGRVRGRRCVRRHLRHVDRHGHARSAQAQANRAGTRCMSRDCGPGARALESPLVRHGVTCFRSIQSPSASPKRIATDPAQRQNHDIVHPPSPRVKSRGQADVLRTCGYARHWFPHA